MNFAAAIAETSAKSKLATTQDAFGILVCACVDVLWPLFNNAQPTLSSTSPTAASKFPLSLFKVMLTILEAILLFLIFLKAVLRDVSPLSKRSEQRYKLNRIMFFHE